MKDEGSNLDAMIIALKLIMSCENMGLDQSFQDFILFLFSLRHVNMLVNEKICRNLKKKC